MFGILSAKIHEWFSNTFGKGSFQRNFELTDKRIRGSRTFLNQIYLIVDIFYFNNTYLKTQRSMVMLL